MKKFLKIFVLILVLLFGALLAAPFLFKGKIVVMVQEEVNKNLNAKVKFNEDISLSLIRNFPNLSLGVNDISVVGIEDFEGDTIFKTKELRLTIDLMSAIKGEEIIVRSLNVDQGKINLIILKNGKANWDIAKAGSADSSATTAEASKFHVKLKKLKMENSSFVWDDREAQIYAELNKLDYNLSGDFTQDLFTLKNEATCGDLTVGFGGVNYLSKVKATATADIDANMPKMHFTFKENQIKLNELELGMDGTFEMTETDMIMDLKFDTRKSDFRNFLSVVPAMYNDNFKDIKTEGKMTLIAFVKGVMNDNSMPGFGLNLKIDDAWFKYPQLPAKIEKIMVALDVQNPDGVDDHTIINLSKFAFELQGDKFDARLLAKTPISNPFIDASFVGKINLDNIVKIVPLPEGTVLSGSIISDLRAKGFINALEKQQFEQFDASGNLNVASLKYQSKDLPQGFNLDAASLSFSPKIVKLNNFDAKIENTDMSMNGDLSNFFPYFFGKGVLKGTLNFKSNLIDANRFLADDAKGAEELKTDTAAMEVVLLPENIDFTLNSDIGKLLYTNMEITNFKGTINLANQKLVFKNVVLNILGSLVSMDGFYETLNPKKPNVQMDFGIRNMDIQKAFTTFNTVKKIAPIAEKMSGIVSTSLKMTMSLNGNMMPIYDELFAEGELTIPNAEISGVKTFEVLSDVLRKPEYKKFAMNNVSIKYKVENGRVHTKPFDVKVAGQNMSLAGSTGFDQTIAYTGVVAIPRKDLGMVNSALENALGQLNKNAGSNIKLNEMVNVNLNLGGTFTKPTISTNLADIAKGEVGSLKDQAMDELNKRKQEIEEKARAEAERLKKEAEDKVRAEAERLKKEAEERVKKEADNLKKKAAEEAKKKLKGLF